MNRTYKVNIFSRKLFYSDVNIESTSNPILRLALL